ncbi:MAG: DUF2283 domain-containing protein [Leptospiraceae bacterium]|nr:DUF2283 domain-containing protein [Leptospiraceae bacterium]
MNKETIIEEFKRLSKEEQKEVLEKLTNNSPMEEERFIIQETETFKIKRTSDFSFIEFVSYNFREGQNELILTQCIDNTDMSVSLKLNGIYEVIPDEKAEANEMIRVIDESGESYLHNRKRFKKKTKEEIEAEKIRDSIEEIRKNPDNLFFHMAGLLDLGLDYFSFSYSKEADLMDVKLTRSNTVISRAVDNIIYDFDSKDEVNGFSILNCRNHLEKYKNRMDE